MRNNRQIAGASAALIGVLLGGASVAAEELKTDKEKQSYALGMNVGRQVKAQSLQVDPDLIIQGLRDSLADSNTLLSEQEAQGALGALRQEARQHAVASRRELLEKNKEAGEAFLAANKSKAGVVTLKSGLQYKVLKPGAGGKPTASDIIVCQYRGTLIDGTEFDSSYKRGKPAAFALRRAMKGWKEALPLMSVGSKWQLFVPAQLAYGTNGAGKLIPPNSPLLFEIELLSIGAGATEAQALRTQPGTGSELGIVQQKAQGMVPDATAAVPLSDLRISFKLDPRLSGPTYGGDHWIAATPFTSPMQIGQEATVEIKVEGVAQNGAPVAAATTEWTPADPGMVTIAPGANNETKITVHHAGQSAVTVASNGVSKQLLVKAKYVGNATQVEISR